MVGTHAGDMIGEVALVIEMGGDAIDIGYYAPKSRAAEDFAELGIHLAQLCRG